MASSLPTYKTLTPKTLKPQTPKPLIPPFPHHPKTLKTPKTFKIKSSSKPTKSHSKPIYTKNPHAIYREIQSHANQNNLKQALTILDYLDQRGIPTNPTTFSSLISACIRSQSLQSGKQVHAHIRINGLDKNEFLLTKLVHMYSSCGSMEDARKVFDEMPVRSVYPWNALLRGSLTLGGRGYRDLLIGFSEMRSLGVEMNVYSFSCLIKSLAGNRGFYGGLKVHCVLVKNGMLGDCVVTTGLIDMYFKCGKVKLACRVFEEVEERDVVVWGAMIAGFGHNRLGREALEYTRWMVEEGVSVNSVILTSILPVIGEIGARNIGREVHAYVIKTKEYSKQLFVQSSLVDMYCKCGDMVSGRKVFYGSAERNTISWTALLSGYVACGRLDQALRSIIWMQQEGFKPDVVTVATVLPVCGKLRALKEGKEIHCYAVKNGFLPGGVSVATSLMMMYSKCGNLDYCIRVFGSMERKNVIAWTAMIECYIESRRLDEALGVFRLMQLSKHRPDSVTVARALSVCGEIKNGKIGKEIHGHVLRKDLESIPFVSAEIVKMYGKWGEIDKAKLTFDGVRVKGSMTWTAIIEAYGYNALYREAVDLLEEMLLGGFSPNQFTFKAVLHICEEGGFVDDAIRLFTLMTRKYKIEASEEHYSIIINVLTHAGRIEEAEKFIKLRSSLA